MSYYLSELTALFIDGTNFYATVKMLANAYYWTWENLETISHFLDRYDGLLALVAVVLALILRPLQNRKKS